MRRTGHRLRGEGRAFPFLLLAEQNWVFAPKLVHVIEKGKIQWQGSVKELLAYEGMRIRYLSI